MNVIIIPIIITLLLGAIAWQKTKGPDPYGLTWLVRVLFAISALFLWIIWGLFA